MKITKRADQCPLVAHLYGPAARCKPKVTIWRSWVLRFCIRPLTERLSSWPSWISARVRSHSRLGPEGHMGHLITNALARPFLHLLISTRRPRRESNYCFRDQPEPSPRSHRRSLARSGERRGRQGAAAIPLVNLSVFISGCCLCDARLIAALLRQHGPGDPCQLVGEGRS